jgi:hypothetical protein
MPRTALDASARTRALAASSHVAAAGGEARRMARVLDEESDREAVLARFVSSLSDRDEELLRRMLADPNLDGTTLDGANLDGGG